MDKCASLEQLTKEQAKKIKNLEEKLSKISADADELNELKKRCSALTLEKAELIEKHNAEIAELQKENFEKILEVVKAGNRG